MWIETQSCMNESLNRRVGTLLRYSLDTCFLFEYIFCRPIRLVGKQGEVQGRNIERREVCLFIY